MPDNLLQTGGAGGIGAVIGAILGFFGIKSRLETIEKNIVGKEMCEIVQKNFHSAFKIQNEMLREIREDIKSLLKSEDSRWPKP